MDGLLIWLQKYKYYFDTQNINLKNDYKRSAMPLCKAKNRPHDIRKMITRTVFVTNYSVSSGES